MRNPIKHFCVKRNLAIHELATILGVTSLDLYFAQGQTEKFGAVRNEVALFFGFQCWSSLVAQARMDEARHTRELTAPGACRLLIYAGPSDNRVIDEEESVTIVNRYRQGTRFAVLWSVDGRFYVDRREGARIKRVQRYELDAASDEYRKAVKEITA